MTDLAIRVADVSKRYRLGTTRGYATLRDSLATAATGSLRRLGALAGRAHPSGGAGHGADGTPDDRELWALRGVSFDVPHGQIVGLIGRNGAGKSTLLKVLSRITPPTTGRIDLRGRLGSLLEVGTGFHPELTGRENVQLNGAILGMTRTEIARKFDEIVAFAEVERFIDTPVKRYSSGMHARLAFAVAAHLDPEILLVDEVLAVGDAAFQKKTLGKMEEVARHGRTVVFVSHNLLAVQGLCQRAIWLDRGQVVVDGPPGAVVSRYLQTSFSALTERVWVDPATAPGTPDMRLHRARVRPVDGTPDDPITVRTPFVMEFEVWNLRPGAHLNVDLQLHNEQGILVFQAGPSETSGWLGRPYPVGLFRDACYVPGDLLNSGVHQVTIQVIRDGGVLLHREADALVFEVRDAIDKRAGWFGSWDGAVRPILDWTTDLVAAGEPTRSSA